MRHLRNSIVAAREALCCGVLLLAAAGCATQPDEPADPEVGQASDQPVAEVCDNQRDDDGDGAVDCADVACGPEDGCELAWREVVAGEDHACSLADNGAVYCWGGGRVRPARVDLPAPMEQIAVARRDGCGLDADGRAYCWPLHRERGETAALEGRPLDVIVRFVELDAGGGSACAIAEQGTIYCWGRRVGDTFGSARQWEADQLAPRFVNVAGQFVELAVHSDHSCAIDAEGAAVCWGENKFGQLGDATTRDRDEPVAVEAGPWAGMAVGPGFTCAWDEQGAASCWGRNDAGQLGVGSTETRKTPTRVDSEAAFVAMDARKNSVCGLTQTDGLWCWGENENGQLGNGTTDSSAKPVAVAPKGDWADVAVGQEFVCAATADGDVKCWGDGGDGQLGDSHAQLRVEEEAWKKRLERYGPVGQAVRRDIRGDDFCLVSREGRIFCQDPINAVHVDYAAADSAGVEEGTLRVEGSVSALAAAPSHLCGVDAEGKLWCMGDNTYGQLGAGSQVSRADEPVAIMPQTSFRAVDTAAEHTCAVTRQNQLFCWGANAFGQVGDGTTAFRWEPVAVAPERRFATVVTAARHSCALTTDGEALCWGDNSSGKLGDGSEDLKSSPTPIDSQQRFAGLSAEGEHTCARTKAGRVFCWGSNQKGQLGQGSWQNQGTPVEVPLDSPAVELSSSVDHSCALSAAGRVSCWGWPFSTRPSVVFDGSEIVELDSNWKVTCAVGSDGGFGCFPALGSSLEGSNRATSPVPVIFR